MHTHFEQLRQEKQIEKEKLQKVRYRKCRIEFLEYEVERLRGLQNKTKYYSRQYSVLSRELHILFRDTL